MHSLITPFTFDAFQENFFERPKYDRDDVFAAIREKSLSLSNNGKIATATLYTTLLSSLREMTGKDKYPFSSLTVTFLNKYEKWMLTPRPVENKQVKRRKKEVTTKSNSITTVSMYMRALRAVFYSHAPENLNNPFTGHDKYEIPYWRERSMALSHEDIARIVRYEAIGEPMQRAKDFWLFSFFANGMNFKDIANLRYSNIHDAEVIKWERIKTAKKGRKPVTIEAPIVRPMAEILDRWGTKPATPDAYVFPILTDGMTPQQQYDAVKQFIKTTNKYLERICNDLNIMHVTTYTARHSYATILKQSGAGIEYISEKLGHRSIKTTQGYLDKFETKTDILWAETIVNKVYNSESSPN